MSSFVIPFGGSALVGFLMGYALKKIIKWALIILGVFLGIILVIQYMTNNGYITGKILWDKMGNDIFGILPAFFLLLLIPSSPYSL
ncbi:MAG TPA: FUN14 domain-containing protein [Candidatus Bathyarchaeia archaeon]|nr:FUN14 domain-containing protein [Candidatus Bathyarchaeia archaeon]